MGNLTSKSSDSIGDQVKPMLTTAQKNFKEVTHPDTILAGRSESTAVTRTDLTVPDSQCFLLHGLLTQSECQHYITETEKIGYSDLSDLFPSNYRSNDRVLSICEPLVDELWKRIEPKLTRKEVISVRPVGFGNQGTWKPFRLNECCKFGRYKAGGHFSPHIDGPWVPREDESSVFTVVIYLNSDFDGGATNFLKEGTQSDVVCSVSPQTGTALVFNHDTLHEGEPVTKGTKYIIRTEIMYQRVDTEMLSDPGSYQNDGNYIHTLTLYQKSWLLEEAGDNEGFTDTYLQALELQRQAQRSISIESTSTNLLFPYEVYLKIFGFLTPRDVCRAMTVCKGWYEICMDGQVWYDMFRTRWPVGANLEAKIDPTKKKFEIRDERPFIRDWYGLYKQRVKMSQPQKVVVMDFGSFSFKCAAVHRKRSTINTASCESVVAMVPGVHDLHLRRFSYERYYSGREAKDKYPGHTVDVVEGGMVRCPQLLPELVTRLYFDVVVRPKYSPVIVLEPPGLWDDKMKKEMCFSFMKLFKQPSVSFLSSAVANLCSLGMSSGVVVDVGAGIVTCAMVWNGVQCDWTNCHPDKATPTKLAEMVHSVIESLRDENKKATLRSLVVLTGGRAMGPELLQTELMKIDKTYSVRLTADPVYSGVLGGCEVANVTHFNEINSKLVFAKDPNTYPNQPRAFFKRPFQDGAFFYSQHVYWWNFLNAGRKDYKSGDMIAYLVHQSGYEWMRDWKEATTQEGLLTSDSGSSEEED